MIYLGNNPVGLNQNVHFDGQDEAAFMGLALAAGDTTQINSSNAVGEYTDEAKIKIQKMLGIYKAPWELIREDTFTNQETANYEVTVDKDGNAFELTDVIVMFETPKQETACSKGGYVYFFNGNTEIYYSSWVNWTQAANADATGMVVTIENKDGLIFVTTKAKSTNTNSASLTSGFREGFTGKYEMIQENKGAITKITYQSILGTAHYKIYGKRKWN